MKEARAGLQVAREQATLRVFLREVANPLSAVALHLETASRRLSRGEDPAKWLGVAQKELDKALDLFERRRTQILSDKPSKNARPRSSRPRPRA